jgi:hypothetical protein
MRYESSLSSPLLLYPVSQQATTGIGNPTGDSAFVAIMSSTANPGPSDWHAATWFTSVAGANYVSFQIGPASAFGALTVGQYYVWVKIVDSSETIVRCVDLLEIT